MKKLNSLCLLGLLVMGLGFVSCSDNEGDSEVGDASLLIGLWEPVHVEWVLEKRWRRWVCG